MKLPPLLVYSVLRLLAFLVPFGAMMLFPIFRHDPWIWLAMLFATLIGVSLSVIFLRRPLGQASERISASRREGVAAATDAAGERDEDVEDDVIDTASPTTAPHDASR